MVSTGPGHQAVRNIANNIKFHMFSAHGKIRKKTRGRQAFCTTTDQDLADIMRRRDVDSGYFQF